MIEMLVLVFKQCKHFLYVYPFVVWKSGFCKMEGLGVLRFGSQGFAKRKASHLNELQAICFEVDTSALGGQK